MRHKFNVFITCKIPDVGIQLLKEAGYTVTVYQGPPPIPLSTLKKNIQQCDALICLLSDSINEEILESAQRLKIIANYAVGYNNIDIEAATRRRIFVSNTPDVLTAATADLTWALLLSVSRRVVEADQFVRQGRFKGWGPELMLGLELTGKTLGIVGAGRIGQAVARRASAFEMKIIYNARQPKPNLEKETGAKFLPLDQLLAEADFVSLHCPLTKETFHLLDEKRLFTMKKGAILINTARGPVVDEQALILALKRGHLWGAGLDVYEHEPQVHPELLKLNNVILLPHIGSATVETRDEMARMVAQNVISVLEQGKPLNPVNAF